ncbi:glycosyltransferase family 39 protein [Maricaulaceae bacterium EIL42A08]|nr:glycosyltransferase family 39 protein [Maricaulaceae bacterium EIL42A08]
MTQPEPHLIASPLDTPRTAFLAAGVVLGVLTVLRIAMAALDPNSLYADETQYWLWAQSLDWGYFSKPPMIAWVIATTTALFGDGDNAVRLGAPLLHLVTASFLGLTAARLFGPRAGFWAATLWAVMPAVWLSSIIISTDAVMMAGWAVGLYALVRLREQPDWTFALILGAAVGWAFLSKYATIYFLIGLAIAIVIDGPSRRALLTLKGAAALALFLALISGNLLWNAANDFATVSHTAANANWQGQLFNAEELLQFVGDQFGIFGPVTFIAFIAAVVIAVRRFSPGEDDRILLVLAGFAVPALVIVAGQAFISRAHANWAASAFAAATLLTAWVLTEGPRWRRYVIYGSVAFHVIAGSAFMALAASPALTDALGRSNDFKRIREWPATAEAVALRAARLGVDAIAFDNRNDFHQTQRYGPQIEAELYMWLRRDGPENFAEATWPLTSDVTGPILIVSERHWEIPVIEADFARIEEIEPIRIDLGGGIERHYRLFIAEGYAQAERTAEFEATVAQPRF